MSTICQHCKKRVAHLILEIVEDDLSIEDDWMAGLFDEEEPSTPLKERTMKVCRPCAQEIQRSMLGGVTMTKPIGKE